MHKVGGFYKRTVRDVSLSGQTVLIRADFNVPLTSDGTIADDFRIRSSLPTIKYLLEQDCKIIICSHLGRPEGKPDERFSLEPVSERLSSLLSLPVMFIHETTMDGVKQRVKRLRTGEVALLENIRFYPGEEANDSDFARELASASGASYFVQDGFGVVHRAHASTDAITHFLPSVAGLLVEKEFTMLRSVIDDPKKPLVSLLGGAKVSDKIIVIENLIPVSDKIVIGGAMANTFLKYKGKPVGKSKCESGLEETLASIYDKAAQKVGAGSVDDFIVLPTDVAVASDISVDARRVTVEVDQVAADEMILDIGPNSIERTGAIIATAKTVVWNGTFGYAELPNFSYGSARAALAVASQQGCTSVIGGGDTADFVLKWANGSTEAFSHISTGGGASLELIAGKPMPGIDALLDA